VRVALQDLVDAHISGFSLACYVIALPGRSHASCSCARRAAVSRVRTSTRRSRWILAQRGATPAVTGEPSPGRWARRRAPDVAQSTSSGGRRMTTHRRFPADRPRRNG
jgi:hypothetical protein